jgi:hypothetical protein
LVTAPKSFDGTKLIIKKLFNAFKAILSKYSKVVCFHSSLIFAGEIGITLGYNTKKLLQNQEKYYKNSQLHSKQL